MLVKQNMGTVYRLRDILNCQSAAIHTSTDKRKITRFKFIDISC